MKNKTQPTKISVVDYIESLDVEVKSDTKKLVTLFKKVTSAKPVLWGEMIGFGSYHYKYDSGREGDMFASGFAVRKNKFTIYGMGHSDTSLLKNLGPHQLSGSCLHIKKLEKIDLQVLEKLIVDGINELKKKYPVIMKSKMVKFNAQTSQKEELPKIGAPAERALAHVGIKKLKDFSKYTEEEIVSLHGMGPKAISILKKELKSKKLSFKK